MLMVCLRVLFFSIVVQVKRVADLSNLYFGDSRDSILIIHNKSMLCIISYVWYSNDALRMMPAEFKNQPALFSIIYMN